MLTLLFGLKTFMYIGKKENKAIFISGFIFPLFLFLISILNTRNIGLAINGAYPGLFLLIVPVIAHFDIPLEKMFGIVMDMVIVLVVGCVILDASGIVDIFKNPLLLAMYDANELAVATKGAQYPVYWKIYMQAGVLLVLYACYSYQHGRKKKCLLCGLTMLLSGSAANPIAWIICIFAMFIEKKEKIKLTPIFFICSICLMILYSVLPYLLTDSDMIIRASALDAYGALFRNDSLKVLFGEGYGTEIYVAARGELSITTEWSFFEMMRWYGLFGLIAFIAVLGYPLKRLIKAKRRWIVFGTAGFLTIAFTNPLLYTTTSMVVYILLYYECFMEKRDMRLLWTEN